MTDHRPGHVPHSHSAAPGELALVHAFLNTWHADGPRERFDSPERMRDWLAKRSLISRTDTVSRREFELIRQLRTALRAMIADARGGTKREELNTLMQKALLVVQFDLNGRPTLAPARSGVQGAIARILAAIVAGEAEGNRQRLKVCRNVDCQRVFYDTSKNRSAVWCSSQLCGNRMAARAYRARSHGLPEG
jgi:predicted RNA-binding Zn ribbon-like protein